MKYVGAHVSSSGGVWNAPINANLIGAKGFAMLLKIKEDGMLNLMIIKLSINLS